MRVTEIELTKNDKSCELATRIELDRSRQTFRLHFRFPPALGDKLKPTADTFIAALLLPSMCINEPLAINAPASRKLVKALPKIMALYNSWNQKYRKIEVSTTQLYDDDTAQPQTSENNSALFLSCGIDSFYALTSLNEHLPESRRLSHLIFIHGFDIALDDVDLFEKAYAAVKDVSDSYGKKLIVSATNIREFTEKFVSWNYCYGAVLASVALCMQGLFRDVYIASDLGLGEMSPKGAHPDLDPLWSTERMNFIHYGHDVKRIERTFAIANNPLAKKHLRVCWENRGGAYNCGRCTPCVRAMLELHLAGNLSEFRTFPTTLTPELVRSMRHYPDKMILQRSEGILLRLRKNGEDELADALAYTIRIARLKLLIGPALPVIAAVKNRLVRPR